MADRCKITKYIPDPTPDSDYFSNGDMICLAQVGGFYEMFSIPKDLSAVSYIAQASGSGLSMAGQSDRRPWIDTGYMYVPRGTPYNSYDTINITTAAKFGEYTPSYTSSSPSDPLASVREFRNELSYAGDASSDFLVTRQKNTINYQLFNAGSISPIKNETQVVYNQLLGTRMICLDSPLRLESWEPVVGWTGTVIDLSVLNGWGINSGSSIEINSAGTHMWILAYKFGSDATLISLSLPAGNGAASIETELNINDFGLSRGYGNYDIFFYGINHCDGEHIYCFNRTQGNTSDNLLACKFDKNLNLVAENTDLINGGTVSTRIMVAGQFV